MHRRDTRLTVRNTLVVALVTRRVDRRAYLDRRLPPEVVLYLLEHFRQATPQRLERGVRVEQLAQPPGHHADDVVEQSAIVEQA
ncbi:hypothetical protein ASE63_25120 [Bosea sp. Root381]|nr:hypothetical protein ASE63_25120 [Bosea sp. Root381]